MLVTSLLMGATLVSSPAQPMPHQYCEREPDGPPKAMGVLTGYGLVLGERYREGSLSQSDLMVAIQRIQAVIREMVQGTPQSACAMILPIELDYDLPRPDMDTVPTAP